jgi:hypothetical protein
MTQVQGVRLNHTILLGRRNQLGYDAALRYDAVVRSLRQEVHSSSNFGSQDVSNLGLSLRASLDSNLDSS